jgi:hypothetical protein
MVQAYSSFKLQISIVILCCNKGKWLERTEHSFKEHNTFVSCLLLNVVVDVCGLWFKHTHDYVRVVHDGKSMIPN